MSETADDAPPFVEIINGAMEFTIPPAYNMGVRAVQARRGFAAATAPIEGNGNHFGVMYAGVLFTVAEMLGGILAVAAFDQAEFYPLVKDVRIRFKAPAKTDVRAQASMSEDEIEQVAAQAAANGKCDYLVEGVVTDSDGRVVATTHATCQLRAHGS